MIDAFWDLQGDRQISMGGAGPIPFMALDRWAARNSVRDFDEFTRLVRALEQAHREETQEA